MAQENSVTLIGRITKPQVSFVEDYNTYKITFVITTMRYNKRVDNPIVVLYGLSESEAREIWSEMKEDSFAIVKGMISTRMAVRRKTCPSCGKMVEYNSLVTEVIAFSPPVVLRENYTASKFAEISNSVHLLGQVCSEPRELNSCAMYQLAVGRRFKVKEQGDTRKDYPWIKSFKKMAEEALKMLGTGSVIYINGSLQTREYNKEIICYHEGCNGTVSFKETVAEVSPRVVEYLNNCNFSSIDTKERGIENET